MEVQGSKGLASVKQESRPNIEALVLGVRCPEVDGLASWKTVLSEHQLRADVASHFAGGGTPGAPRRTSRTRRTRQVSELLDLE